MSVVIIDYGMCNLGSVKRAFEECGASVMISDNPTMGSRQRAHVPDEVRCEVQTCRD